MLTLKTRGLLVCLLSWVTRQKTSRSGSDLERPEVGLEEAPVKAGASHLFLHVLVPYQELAENLYLADQLLELCLVYLGDVVHVGVKLRA